MKRGAILAAASLALLACNEGTPAAEGGEQIATMYRNGSLMPEIRLHFGTFDAAGEANDYNINNCQMTARVLNSNIRAQTQSDEQSVGFWCEPGPYREEGISRQSFEAEFPTGVTGNAAP